MIINSMSAEQAAAAKHFEILEILSKAIQEPQTQVNQDGQTETYFAANTEALWWKTLVVNSDVFGRFALELKAFERLATQAYNNMEPELAQSIATEIMGVVDCYKRSIDAMSSESTRGNNVVTSTLIDRINKTNIDKTLHIEGQDKNMAAKMFGRSEPE